MLSYDDGCESVLVHGVVFRKNVVHRRMRTSIPQPRILLLRGALETERTNSKLSSLSASLGQVILRTPVPTLTSFVYLQHHWNTILPTTSLPITGVQGFPAFPCIQFCRNVLVPPRVTAASLDP